MNLLKRSKIALRMTPEQELERIVATIPAGRVITGQDHKLEYVEVAKLIGLDTKLTMQAELDLYLQQQEIPVYPYTLVHDFMDQLVKHYAKHNEGEFEWLWRPLRKVDQEYVPKHYERWTGQFRNVDIYDQIVPVEILKRVAVVEEKFRGRVAYGVTHITRVPRPDPFLSILQQGHTPIVIGHWDEPGFTLVKK